MFLRHGKVGSSCNTNDDDGQHQDAQTALTLVRLECGTLEHTGHAGIHRGIAVGFRGEEGDWTGWDHSPLLAAPSQRIAES